MNTEEKLTTTVAGIPAALNLDRNSILILAAMGAAVGFIAMMKNYRIEISRNGIILSPATACLSA